MTKLLTAAAIALMSGAAAHAAGGDASMAATDWSGPYVGAHIGGVFGETEYNEPPSTLYGLKMDLSGAIGGAYAGYNHQIGALVVGAEGDIGFGSIEAGPRDVQFGNDYTAFTVDWNAHVRARLGYAAGPFLVYAAAGMALAGVGTDDTDPGWGGVDNTHVGWTVGAGVEHAFTDNILIRVEYLYDDYGSEGGGVTLNGAPAYLIETGLTAHTVRAAMAWKF